MIASQIEREILIDAPVEVVWDIVTRPDQMDRWFSEKADFEPLPGAEGSIRMSERTTYNIRVETVVPNRRFAFRWAYPDGNRPDGRTSLLVEFTFHPEGAGTRLRVVESGFDAIDWEEEAKRDYFEGHSSGWPRLLARLREVVTPNT